MSYTGFVQATQVCFIGGARRSPGDVSSVVDVTLREDDPFVPVEQVGPSGWAAGGAAPVYRPITVTRAPVPPATPPQAPARAQPASRPAPRPALSGPKYSGLLRALASCYVAGAFRSQGAVFAVADFVLLPDAPVEQVQQVGQTDPVMSMTGAGMVATSQPIYSRVPR